MGGSGSTRWGTHHKAATVEGSYGLTVTTLESALRCGPGAHCDLRWKQGGRMVRELSAQVERAPGTGETAGLVVCLLYTVAGVAREGRIAVQSPPQPIRGRPYWLICPGLAGVCGRRVSAVYLPPGAMVYACRQCHGLVYASSQGHDKGTDKGGFGLSGATWRLFRKAAAHGR